MADWLASGRLVDGIIVLTVLEGAVLALLARRPGSRLPAPAMLVPHLLAGIMLLLALRAALTGADWRWVALALFGALLAHLVDLVGLVRGQHARRGHRDNP